MHYFKHSFLNLSTALTIAVLAIAAANVFPTVDPGGEFAGVGGADGTTASASSSGSGGDGGATNDTVPPMPPTAVDATASAFGMIALEWSGESDNIGISGYRIFRDGAWYANVTTRGFEDRSVTPGHPYFYAVKAVDIAGNESLPSIAVSATALLNGTTPPPPPTDLVTFTVSPTPETTCEDGIARTSVVLSTHPITGGYFRLRSSAGMDAMIEPGAYPFPNGTYHWEGSVRDGFTISGTKEGQFTLVASDCGTANTNVPDGTTSPVTAALPPAANMTTPESVSAFALAPPRASEDEIDGPATHLHKDVATASLPASHAQSMENEPEHPEEKTLFATCDSADACRDRCAEDGHRCALFAREWIVAERTVDIDLFEKNNKENGSGTATPDTSQNDGERFIAVVGERVGARVFVDTDQDGIGDYDEVNIYGTDPGKADTNGDGVYDGAQILDGGDPRESTELSVPIALVSDGAATTAPVVAMERMTIRFEDPKAFGPVLSEIATTTHLLAQARLREDGNGNVATVTFAGRSLPNVILTLFIFSEPIIVRVKTDATGAWTYTLDKELEDGTHEVYGAITDASGKILAKSSPLPFVKQAFAVTIGTELPAVPAVTTAPGFTNEENLLLTILIGMAVLGLALALVGFVIRRRRDDDGMAPPGSATLSPTILGSSAAHASSDTYGSSW